MDSAQFLLIVHWNDSIL